jgi:hypothetical protein
MVPIAICHSKKPLKVFPGAGWLPLGWNTFNGFFQDARQHPWVNSFKLMTDLHPVREKN